MSTQSDQQQHATTEPEAIFGWRIEEHDKNRLVLRVERYDSIDQQPGTADHMKWLHDHWLLPVNLMPLPCTITVRFDRHSIEFAYVVYRNGRAVVDVATNSTRKEVATLWLGDKPEQWPFK